MTRRLWTDRHGATGVLVAAALPMLLGATAAAIDVGAVAVEKRRMQGAVDAAALSAAEDPSNASARGHAILIANTAGTPATSTVTRGTLAGTGASRMFSADAAGEAVRVIASYRNPAYFLPAIGLNLPDVTVRATATRRNFGALSIGSGLIAFDDGIVNGLTRALTGSSVGLSALSYQGLANTDIDLFGFLDAVAVRADLGVVSYEQLLTQDIALPVLLRALGDVGGGHGLDAVAAAVNGTPRSLRLGDLIGLDMAGGSAGLTGSGGRSALVAKLGAGDMLGAILAMANRDSVVALNLATGLPGLADLRVEMKVGETIQSSPWVLVNDKGGVEVSTAQVRVNLAAEIGPLLGIGVRLPLAAQVAPARAVLDALPCSPRDTAAVRARAGLARLAIADLAVDEPIPASASALRPAPLIRAPLLAVDAKAFGAIEASAWQPLSFTRADIAAGTSKGFSMTDGVSTLLGSTLRSTDVDVRLLGLGLGIGLPGESQIAGRILDAAPALETALFQLLAMAGVRIGTAQVRVDGYRCGRPVLVA